MEIEYGIKIRIVSLDVALQSYIVKKGRSAWIYSIGEMKKVIAYKVKPYELVKRC